MQTGRELKINHTGGYFPDDKQTLLLKAALLDKTEARKYFEQWLHSYGLAGLQPGSVTFLSDFMDTIDPGSQRMLPLVIHNLGEDTHPYFRFLTGIRKNYWVKVNRILFYAQKVQHILEQNGIPGMPVKGLDLATRYYASEGHRPMNDGDILVPYGYRMQVLELARKGLFNNRVNAADHCMKNFQHAIHLTFEGDVYIDLHWNIFYEYANAADGSDFIWNNTVKVKTSMDISTRMQDAHAFFVSLVHGRRFDMVPPFRWVADTVLIYRNTSHLDWDEVLSLTQKFHFRPFIKKAVNFLAEEFDMKIPPDFLLNLDKISATYLEEAYHDAVSRNIRAGTLVSKIWHRSKERIIFYRLFFKNNIILAIGHLVSWYFNRLKAEIYK